MKNMKRIIALFCLIMMTVGVVSVAALAVDNDSIITETGNTITRAQWLHNLAVLFEMEVEDNNYPDNYYSDLSADHAYYIDMMLNIQFGVIDIPAGGELHPDDRLTREFAAQTLNSCLGYQLEEETYSFSDAEDCAYPADDQVAVNRGWFTLIGGAFLPKAEVQDNEVAVMVADTQTVLGQFEIDENYDSQYTFKDGVVEIPDGTDVTVEDEKVVILNNPVVLNEGQTFVVYINGVPAAYKATGVAVNGNTTTVNAEDVDSEDVLASADAQGSFELDENYEIIPAGNGEVTIDEEEVSVSPSKMPGLRKISGTKPIKRTLTVSNTLSLCDEASITFTVKITNPVIKYSYSTLKREAYTTIDGDAVVSFSANFDIAKAIPSDELELFTVPILGVGSFDVCLDLKLAGSLSGGTTGHLKTGISYTREDGFRLERSFKAKTFSITAEVTGQVGIVLRLGVTKLPVLNAYVWAKVGGKASVKVQQYLDGKKPKECVSFYAYEYASYGASAKVKFLAFSKSFDDEYVVWNETNSPHKIVHHYEDKKEVTACTRGGSNSGGNTGFYFSKGNSAYAGSGWSGSTSNSYGLSASGEPIVLYSYTLDEDENATITKYHGNARSLIMPETIDGYTITKIGGNAFSECTSLRHVRLSNKLTKLAGHSFRDCTSLESIFIPNTLVSGGSDYNPRGAFTNCSSLKDVTIEDGITKIPEFLFLECNGFETITIPDSVTAIGNYAFKDCTSLKDLQIPDSVTSIGYAAFSNCQSLTRISVPESVVSMGNLIFKNCSNLADVELPQNQSKIVQSMFENCMSLEHIDLPSSIKSIEKYAFNGCKALTTICIPTNTTIIYNHAFSNCPSLESFTFENEKATLNTIGTETFYNCTSLKEAILPETVTTINASAFQNCVALEKVYIPQSMKTLGESIFMGDESLNDVTIADYSITTMPKTAFKDCAGLESIVLPKGLTTISAQAFMNDTSLVSVTIPVSVTSIDPSAFSYPKKTVIRGVRGSTAESFANEYGFTFVDITNPAEGIALLDGVERIVMERGQTYRAVMEYYPEDTSDVIALTADNNKVSINGMDITAKAAGDCVITAAATSGVTYEFTVQIIDAKSIAVTTSPYKTNYILGEDLNCDGMVVTVTFNDGSTKEVTDYTVSGFDSSVEGDCTVTVSWVSANNITLKTTFVVHVIDTAPKLTGIAITTPPTHTTFERRASLDVSGMVVMGTYTDGSQQPITGYTLSGYNALKLGKQTITMSYEGFTDTFEVEVVSTSVPATGVSLDKTALSIAVGNSVTLTVTVTPVTATNPSVTWTSSDETVATVANGVVTAKKAGTATITATTVDGGFTATCTVTVTGAVDHTPGDINGDDTLNNKDLNRLMKYLAGEDVDVVEAALDLNGDGAVNNKDLNRLMKYLAGEDVEIF